MQVENGISIEEFYRCAEYLSGFVESEYRNQISTFCKLYPKNPNISTSFNFSTDEFEFYYKLNLNGTQKLPIKTDIEVWSRKKYGLFPHGTDLARLNDNPIAEIILFISGSLGLSFSNKFHSAFINNAEELEQKIRNIRLADGKLNGFLAFINMCKRNHMYLETDEKTTEEVNKYVRQ